MKKIKIGYDIVLLLCTSLFVFIWDINIYWKAFITSVIILISILYYTISIFLKFYTNSQIDILIKALLDELPQKEFKDLLFEIIKTHDHTLNGLFKTWDRISEFADENFSEENQYKVKLLLYHIDDVHKFKPYKVYKAMKMDNTSLFYQYMNAFFEKNVPLKTTIVDFFLSLPYLGLIFYPIIYILSPNNITLFFLPFSLIGSCVFYNPISKKIRASYLFLVFYWFNILIITTLSPFYLSSNDFFENKIYSVLMYTFLFFTIIFSGIWITNKLWTGTEIENKNKGLFVSNIKLLSVIQTKFIIKARWIWLWVAFFSVISFIIVFFALIYYLYFGLGNLYYCFLFSISLFYGGCNTDFNTLKGLYFSMEIISSFVTNTLFLANIVRLLFEPKIKFNKK